MHAAAERLVASSDMAGAGCRPRCLAPRRHQPATYDAGCPSTSGRSSCVLQAAQPRRPSARARVYTPTREEVQASIAPVVAPLLPKAVVPAAAAAVLPSSSSSGSLLGDILAPVEGDMAALTRNLKDVVGNRHPMLLAAAEQIFGAGGKRLRPVIVFLVAHCTAQRAGLKWVVGRGAGRQGRARVGGGGGGGGREEASLTAPPLKPPPTRPCFCCVCAFRELTERHRRLAEITEMIHTASLVHDDVLDDCDIRRGEWRHSCRHGRGGC